LAGSAGLAVGLGAADGPHAIRKTASAVTMGTRRTRDSAAADRSMVVPSQTANGSLVGARPRHDHTTTAGRWRGARSSGHDAAYGSELNRTPVSQGYRNVSTRSSAQTGVETDRGMNPTSTVNGRSATGTAALRPRGATA
jgi:hypothetical protein